MDSILQDKSMLYRKSGRDSRKARMRISVIIPVYNEEKVLKEIIDRVKSVTIVDEIVVVDDCSSQGTQDVLDLIQDASIKIIKHPYNRGKGAAIRTGLAHITGDIVIIQDADLEYDPRDYKNLVEPIENGKADVVYGSRFLLKKWKASTMFHCLVNQFLTSLTNMLFFSHLSYMETCYKVFRTEIIRSLGLTSDRFEIEPEITIRTLKRGHRIYEVPVSYRPRSYGEGNKIGWLDGLKAVYAILKYRIKK